MIKNRADNINNKKDIDLSGASNNSGIQYEDKGWKAVKYYRETDEPKVIKLLIRYSGGLVKNEKQAVYILLGFAILAIIVSLFLWFGNNVYEAPPEPPPSPVQF